MSLEKTITSGQIMAAIMAKLPELPDHEWEAYLKEAEVCANHHGDMDAFGDFFDRMRDVEKTRRHTADDPFIMALCRTGPLGRRGGA